MATLLVHVTIKIESVKLHKDLNPLDNYAVVWLQDAEWDKYTTTKPISKSEPIELFLQTKTDINLEIFDDDLFGKDESRGVATLNIFDSKGELNKHELTDSALNLDLKLKDKLSGSAQIRLLVHQVYSSPMQDTDLSKIKYPFKNLVLEGGGVRGIAYGGAFEILEKRGILKEINRVCGTSAGSIAGLLLCLGGNAAFIRKTLQEVDFSSFKDGNLITNFGLGLYSGNSLAKTIKKLITQLLTDAEISLDQLNNFGLPKIKKAQDITFAHLARLTKDHPNIFKFYHAIGTSVKGDLLNPDKPFQKVEFSHINTPTISLWEATRISMGVPVFFKPIFINGVPYVDGGVLYNYAINVFDENDVVNPETLGLRVDKPHEIANFLDRTQTAKDITDKFREEHGQIPNASDFSSFLAKDIKDFCLLKKSKTNWPPGTCGHFVAAMFLPTQQSTPFTRKERIEE